MKIENFDFASAAISHFVPQNGPAKSTLHPRSNSTWLIIFIHVISSYAVHLVSVVSTICLGTAHHLRKSSFTLVTPWSDLCRNHNSLYCNICGTTTNHRQSFSIDSPVLMLQYASIYWRLLFESCAGYSDYAHFSALCRSLRVVVPFCTSSMFISLCGDLDIIERPRISIDKRRVQNA